MSGEDRRNQLIEVAVDLFSKKGFGGTTTREIAAAAGVTEAIIFRHFATKQELYTAILDYKGLANGSERWSAEAEDFMARNDDEGLFRLILTKIVEVHRTEARFERLMIHAALEGHELAVMHNQFHLTVGTRIKDYLERRQRAGALVKTDPTTILVAVAGAAQFYAMQKYMYQLCPPQLSEEISDETMINDLLRILMSGLRGAV
jgi:TetR/AcrR family transcriptional regulator